nr:MAG TPA: hypothetical protein [Caudoviricetes sp.]
MPFLLPISRRLKLRASGASFSYAILFFCYILSYYRRKEKGENVMNIKELLCVVGIFICTVGTIFSLWNILTAKIERVGTCEQLDNTQESFKKEKTYVICGCLLIIVGGILQIIGTLI